MVIIDKVVFKNGTNKYTLNFKFTSNGYFGITIDDSNCARVWYKIEELENIVKQLKIIAGINYTENKK